MVSTIANEESPELVGDEEQAENAKAKRPAMIMFLCINKVPFDSLYRKLFRKSTAHAVKDQTLVLGCFLRALCHTVLANKNKENLLKTIKSIKLALAASVVLAITACAPSAKQLKEAVEKDPSIVFGAIEKHPDKFIEVVMKAQQEAQKVAGERAQEIAWQAAALRLRGGAVCPWPCHGRTISRARRSRARGPLW